MRQERPVSPCLRNNSQYHKLYGISFWFQFLSPTSFRSFPNLLLSSMPHKRRASRQHAIRTHDTGSGTTARSGENSKSASPRLTARTATAPRRERRRKSHGGTSQPPAGHRRQDRCRPRWRNQSESNRCRPRSRASATRTPFLSFDIQGEMPT